MISAALTLVLYCYFDNEIHTVVFISAITVNPPPH